MPETSPSRLTRQMRFLLEADKLKRVQRTCLLSDGSRFENSAEHSWHLALMAMVLHECAPEPVNLGRTLELLLMHDLVEIDAGDTLIYDEAAVATQSDREERAAQRLFGLLPTDQRDHFAHLRLEFEASSSPEARFARALDALQPAWLHWGDHANPEPEELEVTRILAKKRPALEVFPELWTYLQSIVQNAATRGLLGAVSKNSAQL
jgi:putative hydrolases of HD superfamily